MSLTIGLSGAPPKFSTLLCLVAQSSVRRLRPAEGLCRSVDADRHGRQAVATGAAARLDDSVENAPLLTGRSVRDSPLRRM